MQTKSGRTKRREIFSNSRVQLRIVAVFAIIAMLFIGVNIHIGLHMINSLQNEITQLPLSVANRRDVMVIFAQQSRVLGTQIGILTFLSIFILVVGGTIFSHRIGGPIFQLRKYLTDISTGKTTPRHIRFRKNDFFHSLAAEFNLFQESVGIFRRSPGQSSTDKRNAWSDSEQTPDVD